MKIKLTKNEELYVWTTDKKYGERVDIPKELYERLKKAEKEYYKVQELIDKETDFTSGF